MLSCELMIADSGRRKANTSPMSAAATTPFIMSAALVSECVFCPMPRASNAAVILPPMSGSPLVVSVISTKKKERAT